MTELATRADLAAQVLRLETEMRVDSLHSAVPTPGSPRGSTSLAPSTRGSRWRWPRSSGRLQSLDNRMGSVDGRLSVEAGMDELRRVVLVLHADMLDASRSWAADPGTCHRLGPVSGGPLPSPSL